MRGFFDGWALYDHVLDRDYMHHDAIYACVRDWAAARPWGGRARVLDLGCGSARHAARALQGMPVAEYVACDLSEVALGHAASNLAGAGIPARTRACDLARAVGDEPGPWDLVLCGYSLHHLGSPAKEAFLRGAAGALAAGGALVLVDTVLDEGVGREAGLGAYCDWVASAWTTLDAASVAAIRGHVMGNDFPETASATRAMASRAGLRVAAEFEAHRWHRAWLLERG